MKFRLRPGVRKRMNEAVPCWCCGGEPFYTLATSPKSESGWNVLIECKACDENVHEFRGNYVKDAVELWNEMMATCTPEAPATATDIDNALAVSFE